MKKIFLSAAIVLGICTVNAQFVNDYLRAADEYFKKADYYSAAQYYEKYLAGGKGKANQEVYNPYAVQTTDKKTEQKASSKDLVIYRLGESYRLLNYHIKAEPYYKQALSFDQSQFPLATYWYASTERALEKFEEAEKSFNLFLDNYKNSDTYSESARREIQNLRFIQVQLKKKDLKRYTINKSTDLNATGANYAPAWMNNNTLLFTSTRPEGNASSKNKTYTNNVYQANYGDGSLSGINKVGLPQIKDVHQGAVSITPDGNTIFLTRWTIANGKKTSSIYSSSKSASGWSEPVLLGGEINSSGSNTQQPFVMPDGKHLIFASDKPGGTGGFDLYYADLDNSGKLSGVRSLGSIINTRYDEQAPFYHAPSGTLVFSSNGRIGMGGFDFFQAKGNFESWSEPQNFGYPVNSVKDDIYFASRGSARNMLEDVVLSSDRSAECCLELFALKKEKPLKQIAGVVVVCEGNSPVQGVLVQVVDTINNKVLYTRTTGADGKYSITLEEYQPLKVVAAIDGYHPATLHFFAPSDDELDNLENPALCLIKIPEVGETIILENVYYEFNKAQLLDESFEALDKLVNLMNQNPKMIIEISGHTDNIGKDSYNEKLSAARAQSVVDYLVTKGIDKARLQAKGYGASMPIAPNRLPDGKDNPEGRKKNRRTEFKILSN